MKIMKLTTDNERSLWKDALLARLALNGNEPAECAQLADEVVALYRARTAGAEGIVKGRTTSGDVMLRVSGKKEQ